MATYYDRFDSSTNAGAALWVGDLSTSASGVAVSWEGGWHSFAGSWYVNYIYNSIGRDTGAGEVRRDYVDDGSVSGSGDVWWTSYTETFPRLSTDYNVTLYSYVRASVNGATREAQAEYTFTVPAIPPAFNTLNATRVSDNQANLSWTAASGNISAVCIERSVDGGSFSEVAVIWSASATSWQDNSTTADHSYTYRARYYHSGAYGPYSNTVTVTMTPSAPQTITTAAIQGSTNVAVELGNASPVATSLDWQSSTDGGQTWSASTTVSGSPVTYFTATGISGTAYIRVRNVNAAGTSDWLVSEQVTTICPPAAPTLTSPSGNVVDMASGSVTFSWIHNSLDGSAQTAAQLAYSTNGGSTWTTVTKSTEQSHTISPIPWAAGTAVTWRVRTKGADASYGDWAQARTFNVYTAPTVSITSPGATITGMPISLAATYSDMAGFTCQAATVSLTKDGRTLYKEDATISGTAITASLDVSEFLPTNGETYTVVVTARSSSSLQTSANATFTVDFVEPQAGELSITNDPDTGYASLLATFDNSASEITYTGSTNTQYESTEGYVRSLTVEGKSEKWNQLAPSNASYNSQGNKPMTSGASFKAGDKLYLSARYTITSGTNAMSLSVYGYSGTDSNQIFITASGGSSATVETIKTATLSCTSLGTTALTDGNCWMYAYLNGNTATFDQIKLVNLTAIFGAGNEPATVDAFKATDVYKAKLAAGELYAYDAGSLVSIEGVSVGDGTITTPLRSAGSVHDTLTADTDSWTVARKVGYVDLGTLTWNYYSSAASPFMYTASTALPDIKPNTYAMLCSAYRANGSVGDKRIVSTASTSIRVFDSSYTDPETFKAAMSGVYLFYELATPTVDTETSMSTIEIGSAFTVVTDLDSTFAMTTWDGSADAVSISVSRVNADGTLTLIITEGASGAGTVDRFAPLNTPYQYAVTTKAASQAVSTVYVDNIIESDYWFAYWGENVAKAKWNPDNGGIQVTRPQKTRVYYAGRRDPVSYDGHAVALTETPSWMFIGKDEVDAFVRLIEDGGRGVYKSCDGWVYHADFDLTMTPSYTAIGYYGGASLGITRIAGDRL